MAKKKKLTKAELQQARENGLVYEGQNGAHLTGVPARDLFASEAAVMSDTQLNDCVLSKVYEIAASPIVPVVDAEEDEPETPDKGEESNE